MYYFSIVNKLPQAPWFKTMHVYYLTVSVHQAQFSWVLSSETHTPNNEMSVKMHSHLEA